MLTEYQIAQHAKAGYDDCSDASQRSAVAGNVADLPPLDLVPKFRCCNGHCLLPGLNLEQYVANLA